MNLGNQQKDPLEQHSKQVRPTGGQLRPREPPAEYHQSRQGVSRAPEPAQRLSVLAVRAPSRFWHQRQMLPVAVRAGGSSAVGPKGAAKAGGFWGLLATRLALHAVKILLKGSRQSG